MLEAKGFSKAQSYPEGIPSILERFWNQQVARDRRENRSAQVTFAGVMREGFSG